MYVVQINNRDAFAKQAKACGRPVTVVRNATVVPVQQAGAVVMHPALSIEYALEFEDPNSMGDTRWTFREVVLTDPRGQVFLSDSLWQRLNSNQIDVRVLTRNLTDPLRHIHPSPKTVSQG